MSTAHTELERFREFVVQKLGNGGASISLEEAFREFRAQDSLPSQTSLGKKLREIRREIVASGERLLNLEELRHEVAERRGEHSEDKS